MVLAPTDKSVASAPAGAAVPPVAFLDLAAAYGELKAELDQALLRVGAGGWYLLGDELLTFEREFGTYVGASHCAGVANGLDALHLSLRALQVGPGDEVIVPANTYIATWLAVSQVGARIVPVEPDERTYNIDPARVEAAITSRTKVVLPVHLYGQPADMRALGLICERHGLRLLDDAAQAHGARHHGTRVGASADLTAWSFYPGKNLGALGDAGGITTGDPDLDRDVRRLRNYGSREKYVNEVRGYNSRLDELQSAVLSVKLRHLDDWNARRARQAARYAEGLRDLPLALPFVPEWAEPVWHLFVIRVQERARVQEELRRRGVQTLIHYPIPPYAQEAYAAEAWSADEFPLSTSLAAETLSLPIGPHLSDDDQERVIDALRSVLQ
jgi:dTDP-4-amino-4,6-dideoxygalactose transaminase